MRSLTLLLLIAAAAAQADFNVTQTGGTGWVCNGPAVTEHTTVIEAIESCADQSLSANGAVYEVTFNSAYRVSNTPPVAPDPDPEPDPDPVPTQCTDGIDNDGDGLVDRDDPDCTSPEDDDESGSVDPTPDPDPEPDPDPTPDPGPLGSIPPVPFDYEREPGAVTTSGSLPGSISGGTVLQLADTAVDDSNLSCTASPENPAYILGGTINGAGGVLFISGSGCYFIGTDFNNVQPRTSGGYHVFRDVRVHDHAGKNGISLSGRNIVMADSEVDHNQGDDRHGIYVGPGSDGVWVLRNHVHHNGGDGFQACHGCSGNPPRNVYIGSNVFHSDRENAIDFKFIENVIVEGNTIYGLVSAPKDQEWCFDDGSGCGVFSSGSDGSAIVIGSDGGPNGVTIVGNTVYDVTNATRIEEIAAGSSVVITGNKFHGIRNQCLQLDKNGEGAVFSDNECQTAGRGIFQNWRNNFAGMVVTGNTFDAALADIEYETGSLCGSLTLDYNTFIPLALVVCGGQSYTDEAGINNIGSGNTVQ